MSGRSRARQPAAGSRRTRGAEQQPQPAPAELADGSPKIVSNPIFRCEVGPSQPKPPAADHLVGCVYRPSSLYALVHDPATAAAGSGGNGVGVGKPLPPPPCRAHCVGSRAGSQVPASRSGPALAGAGVPHGRVLRSSGASQQDPFLAAYLACGKSAGGGEDVAGGDRHQQMQKKGKKKKRAAKKRGKEGEGIARGCGIWSGWAAGAKYAGAMSSCRYGCAVAEQQHGDHATATKKEAGEDAAAGPTLDLSWAPTVLSARALERRRQQR